MLTTWQKFIGFLRGLVCLIKGHRFPVYGFRTDCRYFCTRCAKPLEQCHRLDDSPLTPEEMQEAQWGEEYHRDRDAYEEAL